MSNKRFFIIAVIMLFVPKDFIRADDNTKIVDIEYIEMSSWNWEALGYHIKISSDGSYESYLKRGDTIEGEIKKGEIADEELNRLIKSFQKCNFYGLKNRYKEPKKITRMGKNYLLTIKTINKTKSVEFYSESKNIPICLRKIVKQIEEIYSGKAISEGLNQIK